MQRLCMFRVQRRTSPSQAGAAAPAGMRAALMALAPLLRSCYPLAVLGTSPPWYRSRSYRARVVGLSCSPPPPPHPGLWRMPACTAQLSSRLEPGEQSLHGVRPCSVPTRTGAGPRRRC